MTRTSLRAFGCLVLLAAMSCSPEREALTQVMVVVDSSMTKITAVRVRVEGMGEPKVATASDLAKQPLPRTVAVVHRGGPLGPITIIAEGLAGNSTLVSRRAQLSFVRGRNVMLELELEQSCVGIKCESNETCVAGECAPIEVNASKLPDWTGKTSKHQDAGVDDPDSGTGEGGGTSGTGGSSGSGGHAGTMVSGGDGGAGAGAGGGGIPMSGSGGAMVMQSCSACEFDSGVTPHGQLSCDDGVCNLQCDSGYVDEDGLPGSGCEKAMGPFPWNVPNVSWKVSNIDPANPALAAVTVDTISFDCSADIDLGVGPLASTFDVCGGQLQPVVVTQPSGPEIVVFATKHLQVTSGSVVRFSGARAVAFVVYGDAEIDGRLDVGAKKTSSGAGADMLCTPGAGGNGANADHGGGGGGGGFGTSGGTGAKSVTENAAGGPGGATSSESTLTPLRGGCSGGNGGSADGSPAVGGGGGGALQISASGRLLITKTIAAPGGGGAAGLDIGDGGGGGGSGGSILLEATELETSSGAWLTANGGGGGTGHLATADPKSGADGNPASSTPAAGGSSTSVLNNSSNGGNGAAGTVTTTSAPAACTGSSVGCGGGGGGGGMGRIIVRSGSCQLAGNASPSVTCSPPSS